VIRLDLELTEVDFIANLLAAVPTGQTVQANMMHLLPKIAAQAQESVEREKAELTLGQLGIEQATQ
jgi:hypothetical protein